LYFVSKSELNWILVEQGRKIREQRQSQLNKSRKMSQDGNKSLVLEGYDEFLGGEFKLYLQKEEDLRKKNEEIDTLNRIKVLKIWKGLRNKLTNERGIWYNEHEKSFLLYKINKIEDSMRRRFFIKNDKHWNDRQYLEKPELYCLIPQKVNKLKDIKKRRKNTDTFTELITANLTKDDIMQINTNGNINEGTPNSNQNFNSSPASNSI
jgi:hypothetical protein